MQFKLIGDLHGELTTKRLFVSTIPVLQIGDLDINPGYTKWEMPDDGVWRGFIDGNHEYFPSLKLDNPRPYQVAKNMHHIPRAFVSGTVMFFGGANSIDWAVRVAGRDWFPDEMPSQRQHGRAMDYPGRITTVIAHTAPNQVVKQILPQGCEPFDTPDGLVFDDIFDKFRPKRWICGHWHLKKRFTHRDCQFTVLDINESMITELDVDELDFRTNRRCN